jgi:hypothetical protein
MFMGSFPHTKCLYRRAGAAVTLLAIALILAPIVPAQIARRGRVSKGPRALGLLELAPNGKAHLIPITILYDGRFYDAGAYKASPVPMALEPQTVYEALRTGVSQGLFTITGAGQVKDAWIAEGTWQPAGSVPTRLAHKADEKPIMGDEGDAPPTLRRHDAQKPTSGTPSAETPPAATPTSGTTPPASSPAPTPQAGPSSLPPATASTPPSAPAPAQSTMPTPETPADTDHPVLHRGKVTQTYQGRPEPSPKVAASKPADAKSASVQAVNAKPALQLIPAISDADGPDPSPYTYQTKPEEEQVLQKKMLVLASDAIRERTKQLGELAPEPAMPASARAAGSPTRTRRTTPTATSQPTFDHIQFRIFDLSNSNEPTLVLTATARLPHPAKPGETGSADLQYLLTVVGRSDIYGDLHKIFTNVTDTRHLDAIPRMELIDAVDADGDARGELLFRLTSDAGSAFNVYRVVGDQLYPLFEGTPQ